MTQFSTDKFTCISTEPIWQTARYSNDATQIIAEAQQPESILSALMLHNLHLDSITLLAHCLPKKEAIWWGYLCCQQVDTDQTTHAMLYQSVQHWLKQGEESQRRECERLARDKELDFAICWVAMGVFWSNGSIAEESMPEVYAASDMTYKAVTGAIQMAAVQYNPANATQHYQTFIDQGTQIATGRLALSQWVAR